MSGIKRIRILFLFGLVAGFGPDFLRGAYAQIAFVPEVSPFLDGAYVGVTPVVSADRRYVRLGINVSFSQLNGFTTYSVPAAVSGSPGAGGGGLGGLGGLLGAGGGGGGGGAGRIGSLIQGGEPLGGPFAFRGDGGAPILRDGQNPEAANWPKISTDGDEAAPEVGPAEPVPPASRVGHQRSIRADIKAAQSQRAAALKSARQLTASARRRAR